MVVNTFCKVGAARKAGKELQEEKTTQSQTMGKQVTIHKVNTV